MNYSKCDSKSLCCLIFFFTMIVLVAAIVTSVAVQKCWNCKEKTDQTEDLQAKIKNLELLLSDKEEMIKVLNLSLIACLKKKGSMERNISALRNETLLLEHQALELNVEKKALQGEVTEWKKNFTKVAQLAEGCTHRYTEAKEQQKKAEAAQAQCEASRKKLEMNK
nr:PREDICTED: uncharacterized protein LOC106704551 [Latimeria chalumnae]|eukprot:XP_014347293.1 PREDICTED: uncharacterized protein LOC106704551 [Latimeria chalumnae]